MLPRLSFCFFACLLRSLCQWRWKTVPTWCEPTRTVAPHLDVQGQCHAPSACTRCWHAGQRAQMEKAKVLDKKPAAWPKTKTFLTFCSGCMGQHVHIIPYTYPMFVRCALWLHGSNVGGRSHDVHIFCHPWPSFSLFFKLLSVSHQRLRTGKHNTCFHMRSNPQNPRAVP